MAGTEGCGLTTLTDQRTAYYTVSMLNTGRQIVSVVISRNVHAKQQEAGHEAANKLNRIIFKHCRYCKKA